MSDPPDSARLRFRRITLADATFLARLLSDPTYIAHVADRGVRTEADAVAYIERTILPAGREPGLGPYLMEERGTGEAVGLCGLFQREGFARPDLGYAVLPPFRGRGYAREAALVFRDHARDVLGLESLGGYTSPANASSIRILRRLGMTEVRTFTMAGYAGETVEYRITFRDPAPQGVGPHH